MAFGIERPNTRLRIRVPGGVVVGPVTTSMAPGKFEIVQGLLGSLSSILAPIQPILSLVRFGKAVIAFVQALGGVIAVPPDLEALRSATDELIEAGTDVLSLEPTAAIGVMVKDTLDALRALADGLDEQLEFIEQVQQGAASTRAAAEQDFVPAEAAALMEADAACLDEVAETLAGSLSDVLEPVDLLLGTINTIGEALSVTVIPTIGTFETVAAAREAVDAFRRALAAIPI